MRTTVTIDDELLAEAKAFAARQRRTLSEVVQDSLRAAITNIPASRPLSDFPTFEGNAIVDILDKEALAEVLGDNEWPRRDDADR